MVLILVDTKDLDLLLNTGEYWGTIAEYVSEKRATVGVPLGRSASPAVRRAQQGKKRKPSAWNKFVKANSKKPRFKYRNGKLNLKKMAVAFRKTPAGKKKRR